LISHRQATEADIAAMWALRTRAVITNCATHYSKEIIQKWAPAGVPKTYPRLIETGCAIVAEDGDVLLGYGIVDLASAEVEAMFVDPQWGGRGIGRQLMATLEEMALARAFTQLHVTASLNAVAFYQAFGFVRVRDELYAHACGVNLACVYLEKRIGLAG
jgi:putative acetyltransferase